MHGASPSSTASLWAAGQHRDQIKKFIVTDANDDPSKQIADIQDLISQGVDLLLIAPSKGDALDQLSLAEPSNRAFPVVLVDRSVPTRANYITFITASATRRSAGSRPNGFGEYLQRGRGTSSCCLVSPARARPNLRIKANSEVFAKFPGIKVLRWMHHTDWEFPEPGKTVMAALIQNIRQANRRGARRQRAAGSGAIEAMIDAGYTKGQFPPITGGDVAHMYQLASKYEIPMVGIDYPTSMGITGVETALDVLAGIAVPDKVEVNAQIVMTPGAETVSVKPDRLLLDHVSMSDPGDLVARATDFLLATTRRPSSPTTPTSWLLRRRRRRRLPPSQPRSPPCRLRSGTGMSDPVLTLKAIEKYYPGVKPLDRVDFSVQSGEIHALLGENGAGKSTLTRIIGGATKPDSGVIEYCAARSSTGVRPSQARDAGIHVIHQSCALLSGTDGRGKYSHLIISLVTHWVLSQPQPVSSGRKRL